MPRSLYPSRPIQVVKVRIGSRHRYYLLSDNGYIYHHWDNVWRVRKLNDPLKYCYINKIQAQAQCRVFMRPSSLYV